MKRARVHNWKSSLVVPMNQYIYIYIYIYKNQVHKMRTCCA
ncbi:MAG: hypothetical protein N7Q72_04415 [Spiroplasma sp. Tabriz.8]|nr:hypothetical protein [Spiroplasma sp. Tabriz.8]